MLRFACPSCSFKLSSPTSRPGDTFACTSCKASFVIPPLIIKKTSVKFTCPKCNADYESNIKLINKDVECKACKASFTIPPNDGPGIPIVKRMTEADTVESKRRGPVILPASMFGYNPPNPGKNYTLGERLRTPISKQPEVLFVLPVIIWCAITWYSYYTWPVSIYVKGDSLSRMIDDNEFRKHSNFYAMLSYGLATIAFAAVFYYWRRVRYFTKPD